MVGNPKGIRTGCLLDPGEVAETPAFCTSGFPAVRDEGTLAGASLCGPNDQQNTHSVL